ncbi:hypothetical protein GC194_05355 [bacterium]|nr:hypothetical protein [bacterium]
MIVKLFKKTCIVAFVVLSASFNSDDYKIVKIDGYFVWKFMRYKDGPFKDWKRQGISSAFITSSNLLEAKESNNPLYQFMPQKDTFFVPDVCHDVVCHDLFDSLDCKYPRLLEEFSVRRCVEKLSRNVYFDYIKVTMSCYERMATCNELRIPGDITQCGKDDSVHVFLLNDVKACACSN